METAESSVAAPALAWDAVHAAWRVLVLGATGAVGREVVQALLAAGHPPSKLFLHARSGHVLEWRGERLKVEPLQLSLPQAEVAILCTPPELAGELGPLLAARGTRVLDLSGASRSRPEVPLVLEGINAQELGAFTEIIALPLRATALIALPLALLDRTVGLAEVNVFCVLSAASQGARGILALRRELQELAASGGTLPRDSAGRVGNLRPVSPEPDGRDIGDEIATEIGRLLRRPDLLLDVAAHQGDLERCDVFAIRALLHGNLEPESAAQILSRSSSIQVEWDGAGPAPTRLAGSTRIHVGRFRAGSRGSRSLCFSAAGDELRAGAAQAALRVAARLPAGV